MYQQFNHKLKILWRSLMKAIRDEAYMNFAHMLGGNIRFCRLKKFKPQNKKLDFNKQNKFSKKSLLSMLLQLKSYINK